jgi:hypothetical protein
VNTTITLRASSRLGTFFALALVVAVLIVAGLYLLTDGGFFTALRDSLARLSPAQSAVQAVQDALRKYDRPHLLTGFALLIVGGAAAVGLLGSFIRTNEYRFVAGADFVEKRGLWLHLPLCVLAWAALTALLMLCDKWAIASATRVLLGQSVSDKLGGFLLTPLWIAISGAMAWLVLWTSWQRLRPWLDRSLCVPGLRRAVPFTRIRRLEIRNTSEGATVLVLILANGAAWTIQTGRVQRLQRLAVVLSRRLGLERRDFVTWA